MPYWWPQVMLGLVTDIKNNKRRPGKGADAAPPVLPAAVQSWLKASGVGEVELRNVTWAKLLGSNKRVRGGARIVPSPWQQSCHVEGWILRQEVSEAELALLPMAAVLSRCEMIYAETSARV